MHRESNVDGTRTARGRPPVRPRDLAAFLNRKSRSPVCRHGPMRSADLPTAVGTRASHSSADCRAHRTSKMHASRDDGCPQAPDLPPTAGHPSSTICAPHFAAARMCARAVDYCSSASSRHIVNEIDWSAPISGRVLGHPGGTRMIQPVMFAIVLYLTPSVLLLALLTCREGFDYQPD